jgi:alanine dehydrogenase
VPVTSTHALTNATMPFVIDLADNGLAALRDDPGLRAGPNVCAGQVTCDPVAQAVGLTAVEAATALVS